MTEPVIIEPTIMKSAGDCGVCCLRMLTGKTYSEVVAVVPKRARKTFMADGLTVMQLCNMSRRLGYPLGYHDEDFNPDWIGILTLERTIANADGSHDFHAVMWLTGQIFNPADGWIYTDLETYLARTNYKVEGFLFRRDIYGTEGDRRRSDD